MIEIMICIGSSCHLKGSHEISEEVKRLILKNKAEDQVNFKASFCMEDCQRGVCMEVNGKKITELTTKNTASVFAREILPLLKERGAHE